MRRIVQSLATGVAVAGLVASAGAQAPQQPKPGPEHKRLGYFVGTWKTEGKVEPGPMGPGGKMTSTETCEWFEGGFAVICRGEGQSPIGPGESIGIMTYNQDQKFYTYYGVDSSGMMSMTSIPRGTVQGSTWTYTDESMMGGQKLKNRVTLEEVSPKEYTFKMEIQGADGKWMPVMESKSTKAK